MTQDPGWTVARETGAALPERTRAAVERVVATYDTVLEAELARGRLEVDGIEARIVDGNTIGMAQPLSLAVGGAKLVVAEADVDAARAALQAPEAPTNDDDVDDDRPATAALTADQLANRALRASVLGLVLVPPVGHVWSLVLLRTVVHRRGELSAKGRLQAAAAALLSVAVCAAALVALSQVR